MRVAAPRGFKSIRLIVALGSRISQTDLPKVPLCIRLSRCAIFGQPPGGRLSAWEGPRPIAIVASLETPAAGPPRSDRGSLGSTVLHALARLLAHSPRGSTVVSSLVMVVGRCPAAAPPG